MAGFHEGELEVQHRAGVAAMAQKVGRIIRREIPDAARAFAAERTFVILGAADAGGRMWATVLRGEPGFLSVPADDRVWIEASLHEGDPLAASLAMGSDVGLLLIEPATRRRMRINGRARRTASGVLEVAAREVYANCPKYITPRQVSLGSAESRGPRAERGASLTDAQVRTIEDSDTLFIASRHPEAGADASHRGGTPGFVKVVAPDRLVMPDYQGNMMFNTLGNLAVDPRAGLLFVDFDRGNTLQLTGRATIVWDGSELAGFPGAQRLVEFTIDAVVETSWSRASRDS
jgi:predicted pyridoxine 5'-phosphate oxidase superfamily flavin-nucleotide-binding protein